MQENQEYRLDLAAPFAVAFDNFLRRSARTHPRNGCLPCPRINQGFREFYASGLTISESE